AFRGLDGLKDRTFREIGIVMLVALRFVFLAEKLETNTEVFTNYVFYVSALFIIVYAIIFYGIRRGRIYKDILIIILIAVCIIENVVNTSVTSVPTVGRDDYIEYDDGINAAMEIIREKEGPDSFYRVEKAQLRTKNDGAWLHFPSISTFSSVANVHLTDFYTTIGLESSANAYGSYGQTFLTNMLMSVKYTIAQKKLPDSDLYTLTYTNGTNVWVYENNYTLPVGYAFKDPNNIYSWMDTSSTPLENQNALVRNVLGFETLFVDVTPRYTGSTSVHLTVEESGFYYAYATTSGPKSIRVSNPDSGLNRNFTSLNRSFTMELGWCNKGESLTFSNTEENSTKNVAVTLYRMDEEVLKEFYNKANEAPFVVEHFEDTKITGYVDVPQGGALLFTTIAAEEGWEVFVDGQKADYQTLKKTYIGQFLNAGRHNIEFRYHVPMLLPSAIISIVAWLIMLLIGLLPLLKKAADKRRVGKAAAAAGVPAIIETDAAEPVIRPEEISVSEEKEKAAGEAAPSEETGEAPEETEALEQAAEAPEETEALEQAAEEPEETAEGGSVNEASEVPEEKALSEDASKEEVAEEVEMIPPDDSDEKPLDSAPEGNETPVPADLPRSDMEDFEEAFSDANEQRDSFFWETPGKINASEPATSTIQLEEEVPKEQG
ncbi:MAG: YfhO family protein, partial [Lachnospiraceae bacterium]|nr:YfhO family protein [Lachnospiraceae bacterium]